MSASDIYVDEVHIAYSQTAAASGANFLDSESCYQGDKGNEYKWLVAIGNKNTTTAYNCGATDLLRMCTDYWDSNDEDSQQKDIDFWLVGHVIPPKGQIFVGFASTSGFVHTCNDTGTPNLISGIGIADDKDGDGNIIASTRFRLRIGGSFTDNVFNNAHIAGGITHNLGAYYYTLNNQTANSSVRRIPAHASANTAWTTSEWRVSASADYLSASAAGDPHICTLFGEHYEFDHLGAIRLFDNQHARSGKDNDLIIINGLVEPGPGRWAKRQYIQKLFVYNAGKTMVVNLGFRGSKVVVEHNDGIPYEEEELGFHDDALMHAFTGTASFKDPEKAKEYAELHGVLVPPLVRNQITFELCGSEEDTAAHKVELTVTLSNVNKYNLQPCRINIDTGNDFNKKLATGCLMHRKYATHCALDSLTNIDDLPEPTKEEMKNMPELEIKPMLRNVQWQ